MKRAEKEILLEKSKNGKSKIISCIFSILLEESQSTSAPHALGFIASGNSIHKYSVLSPANITPTLC